MSAPPQAQQLPPHVMIVAARFYPEISEELVRGAVAEVQAVGGTFKTFFVPGVFEVPATIKYAIRAMELYQSKRRFDCYVALGCVIRGETTHYDYVCAESARGLMDLSLQYSLAVGYGILTVENEEQAWARARVDGRNKGGEAALTALHMNQVKRELGLFPRLKG